MLLYSGRFKWHRYDDSEQFTVILPYGFPRLDDPIHIYWQKAHPPQGKDGHLLHQTFITAANRSAQTADFELSCGVSNGMTFTFYLEETSLKGRMINPEGEASDDVDLPRGYSSNTNLSEGPDPLIYAGKLTGIASMQDDMVLVVLPEGFGDSLPVLAFWQKRYRDTDKKVSCDARKIQSHWEADHERGDEACSFAIAEKDMWSMQCSAAPADNDDNDLDPLTVTFTTTDDGVTSFSLKKQPLLGPGSRRGRSLLKNSHTTVFNDTKSIIVCTFNSGPSAINSEAIAWAGFAWTALSILVPQIAGTNLVVDSAITATSVLLSALGVVDVYLPPGEKRVSILCPNDSMSNTSKGGLLYSVNSIAVIKATIEDGNHFTVWTGTASELGDVTINLSDKGTVSWTKAFQIELPHPHRIGIERRFRIQGLQPKYSPGKPLDSKSGLAPDAYALSIQRTNPGAKDTTTSIKWHPSELSKPYGASSINEKYFSHHPDWTFVITQVLSRSGVVKAGAFVVVSCLNDQAILRIQDATVIDEKSQGERLVKHTDNETDVCNAIRPKLGYFAYTWNWQPHRETKYGKTEDKRMVHAWQRSANIEIRHCKSTFLRGGYARSFTYLLVSMEQIETRQVLMEGT
jgi:hypothetical protein